MPAASQQVDPTDLPLLQPDAFIYEGAFRLPADEFGVSSLNYSEGPIALNPENGSLFIVGHSHHQAIAEFKIPALVQSDRLEDLNRADAPLQPFYGLLDRTANNQSLDRIGGMLLLDTSGGKSLMVNAYEYYDAPGDNTHTSLIVEEAAQLGVSAVEGFYTFEGGAGHTSGWMSPIPAIWQPVLGGTHLTGQSSGIPIISRTSVGPSAFSFTPSTLTNASQMIETTRLLDFSLNQPLHADLENTSASNKLWTHLSRAVYGVIIPEGRTYLTVGYSGGHESGVCYKCTQNAKNICTESYFIKDGILRAYFIKEEKEISEYFCSKNEWMNSPKSFTQRIKDIYYIDAIEKTEAYCIHINDLGYLFDHFPEMERYARLSMGTFFGHVMERITSIRFTTAKEKYDHFCETYQEIYHRIPLGMVASYLGITAETLSRIRKQS